MKWIYIVIPVSLFVGIPLLLRSTATTSQDTLPLQSHVRVVLDPSDHISKKRAPNRAAQNRILVEQTANYFASRAKQALFFGSHKLQVDVIPQIGSPDLYRYEPDLLVDLARIPYPVRKDTLPDLTDNLKKASELLLNDLSELNHYDGADVLGYFSSLQLDSVTVRGEPVTTCVILPTDGYVYAGSIKERRGNRTNYMPGVINELRGKENWKALWDQEDYGLFPVRDFSGFNIRILVLGIEPRAYFEELEIIEKYWSQLFEEMGVTDYRVHAHKTANEESAILNRFLQEC